jgi:hypothetical protein
VKVKVTLRLAVYCQSVRLGVKPLQTHDQTFFSNLTPALIDLLQTVGIHTWHGPHRKHLFIWIVWEVMFTELFPSNRSPLLQHGPHRKHFYCIVDRLCMLDCLQSCCLAMLSSNPSQYFPSVILSFSSLQWIKFLYYFLDFVTVMVFVKYASNYVGRRYTSFASILVFFLFGWNILLSTLFSSTLSLCSSIKAKLLRVRKQVKLCS